MLVSLLDGCFLSNHKSRTKSLRFGDMQRVKAKGGGAGGLGWARKTKQNLDRKPIGSALAIGNKTTVAQANADL